MIALLGSILLFVGVFAPFLNVPMAGSISYFQNSKFEGAVIMVLAFVSFILTLGKRLRALVITGAVSLGVSLYTFVRLKQRADEAKSEIEKSLGGNPFEDLTDMFFQSMEPQWGWALLLVGSVLLITAGLLGKSRLE
ncbi:MAG: hypothetical protein L0Y74_04775 [candidate division Zixibacteria bacterium]|nr:hypothetical protein [candidate division Zixibacteria bacterium]